MTGSVIIPAHNEASVLARTLAPLAELVRDGSLDVVVAANGCDDATAQVARGVPGVVVLELSTPSKVAALNAADARTDRFPRIYLDADIVAPTRSVLAVLAELRQGPTLAARPPFVYDTAGASALVQAYYRARMRLPANTSGLWGAGFYGLSREGRSRFEEFPPLVADDYFVDTLFVDEEKRVVETDPVEVRVPRTATGLRRVLRRTYGGNVELREHVRAGAGRSLTSSGNGSALLRSATSASSLRDGLVYAGFAVAGRSIGRPGPVVWHRDDSSRS